MGTREKESQVGVKPSSLIVAWWSHRQEGCLSRPYSIPPGLTASCWLPQAQGRPRGGPQLLGTPKPPGLSLFCLSPSFLSSPSSVLLLCWRPSTLKVALLDVSRTLKISMKVPFKRWTGMPGVTTGVWWGVCSWGQGQKSEQKEPGGGGGSEGETEVQVGHSDGNWKGNLERDKGKRGRGRNWGATPPRDF